jgi:hypothetical protein
MRRWFCGLVLLLAVGGCLPGDGMSNELDPAGFFSGIWHGWISPIALVIGFFSPDIRIYEAYNTGWWYEFGYYMAIISGFGGLSFVRRNKD